MLYPPKLSIYQLKNIGTFIPLNKLRLGIISQKKVVNVVKCWNLGIGEKSL